MEYIDQNGTIWNYKIGKNQKDNDHIISLASPTDVWFHLQEESSPHLIVSNPEDLKLPQTVIKYFARQVLLAKKIPKAYVMYTQIKYIKKTKTIGTVEVNSFKSVFVSA